MSAIRILILMSICGFLSIKSTFVVAETGMPTGYIACALHGDTCKIKPGQSTTLYYGANNSFAQLANMSGNVLCTDTALNVPDPIRNTLKSCYIAMEAATGPGGTGVMSDALPSGFTSCATDGKKCEVTGSWLGYYGAGSNYAQIEGSGSFVCLPGTFNIVDPANKVQKTCYVQSTERSAAGDGVIVASVPAGYRACVTDGQMCAVSGSWNGYYGVNGVFAQIKGTDSFVCLPDTFGIPDPVPHSTKTCYVNASDPVAPAPSETYVDSVPQGYSACATDGGNCMVSGNWDGYYGANEKFLKISGVGNFTCLPDSLGVEDPVYGTTKTCYINSGDSRATGTGVTLNLLPSGYTPCAIDGKVCTMSGEWTGYYGTSNVYAQIQGKGSFLCMPNTFDIADPKFGVQKTCYVKSGGTFEHNCSYTNQANLAISSSVISEAQCSCRCHVNIARAGTCYFETKRINDFACLPGLDP